MNQSPAGADKLSAQGYAGTFFATRIGSTARVVQTNPTLTSLPPVQALKYSGAYPVSRLQVEDTALTQGLLTNLSLFGYPAYKVNDMEASARPAVAFPLALQAAASLPDGSVEVITRITQVTLITPNDPNNPK